jgi:cell filamentation protein, protein adenylyltransferase
MPNNRSGQYITQPTGYRAFIPSRLPPDPPIQLTGELQQLLSEADLALGRLDGSIQTLPDPDLFVFMYVRAEAVFSSQIEGTQSSLQDVLEAEAQIFSPKRPKDVVEVVNYVNAMNFGLNSLTSLPLSIRLIKQVHKRLLTGVRGSNLTPGNIRTSQNWIGPANCTLNEATFVPPPPSEVMEHLGALETYLHTSDDLPLLVRIALAHAQFETIHPFLDGNGRVGRLLITFLMCERGVLSKPVLYLSHYLKKYRSDYYDALQRVRDLGDWESWLHFFLRSVISVSAEATSSVRSILALRESDRTAIAMALGRGAGSGHRVHEYLFQHPVVSVNEIKKLLKVTYTAANTIVSRLEQLGILEEYTGQSRNRRFIYAGYMGLFS